MGYESRLFIVNRKKYDSDGKIKFVYAEKLAMINMCKMEYSFRELFVTPIDFDLYGDVSGEEDLSVDCYGDKCKYTDFMTVIEWLNRETEVSNYRRLKPLLAYLEAFNPDEWDELIVVHYGY